MLGWLASKGRKAHGAVSTGQIKVILERNGQTVEWAKWLARPLQVKIQGFCAVSCFVEEGIAEAVGLASVNKEEA